MLNQILDIQYCVINLPSLGFTIRTLHDRHPAEASADMLPSVEGNTSR
jgi:hypothetical protein